jgi:hypothetical protein
MTARIARTVVSVAAVALGAACTHFYEIPIETPIRSTLDVSAFQRVLVAGFIAGGTEDVDGNVETTRLLRSQLRSKSALRVIDADTAVEPPPPIKDVKDLEQYESLFANAAYWKQIGDEFQQPLIVTGTVMFTSVETTRSVIRNEEEYDQFGRRSTRTVRAFMPLKGFELRPQFIFIDGRDGSRIHSVSFTESNTYGPNQQTPPLSSYFELMDRLIPSVLGTMSSQKVKGTRFLLQ